MLSHPSMQALIESHGIEFVPVGPNINVGKDVGDAHRKSRNMLSGLINASRYVFAKLQHAHDDIMMGCRDADLIVSSASTGAGMNEAELLGLPYASMTFMPWIIPTHGVMLALSEKLINTAMVWLARYIMIRPFNQIRREYGLPLLNAEGLTSSALNLIPISPHVFGEHSHWRPQHRVCGYWFSEEPEEWSPPQELLAFLEAGEPPIVITIGSLGIVSSDALATANMFIESIQQAGVRAIIQSWTHELQQLVLPPTIYAADAMPHSWLLPRAGGVVHHGGFGTTGAGFRAGTPTLIIPHIADQFFWSQHVERLGVGVRAINRSKISVGNLAAAFAELANNPDIRSAASKLGENIRNETGVDNAVRLIEETFSP